MLGRPEMVGSAPKIFTRRNLAEDKITELEVSKLDGSYVDHKNKITVAEYARDWTCDRSGPLNHRQSGSGLAPGAHCIYQARRQEGLWRSSERGAAWTTEPSQTPSPGTVPLLSGRSPAALVTPHGACFCRRASLISARPTARADTSVSTPGARSIASHRCIAPRSVTLALATHSLAVSADTCVLRRGLVVPSTVCVFGVLGVSGEGGKC